MGAGIAQVSAAAGYKTIVREVNQGALDKGLGRIQKFLDDGCRKGKVTAEQRDTTLAQPHRRRRSSQAMKDCDLIIEAIVENLDEKAAAYTALEAGRRPAHDLRVEHLVALHHRAGGARRSGRIGSAGCTSSIRCR